jgi:predicted Zn-dependent protease
MRRFMLPAACAAALVLSSCQSLTGALDDLGLDLGDSAVASKVVQTAVEVAPDIAKALEEITPEQEYYIGRAVGAQVFAAYKAYDQPALNLYLNRLGQSLALFSERPEIFGGYRFIALDSQEINAFATPSGLIMVSRGLIGITQSEDELASVLAHEICHVTLKHGLKSIRSARFGTALGTVTKKAGEALLGDELKEVTGAFSDSIDDITKTMVVSGYSKTAEFGADMEAAKLLARTGYDPRALERVLTSMQKKLDPKAKDFSKTHPAPKDRIKALKTVLDALDVESPPPDPYRAERYAAAMKFN